MKIRARVLYEDGKIEGLLIPIDMSQGNSLVDLSGRGSLVTCAVLDGGDHMYTMGFTMGKFESLPTVELEVDFGNLLVEEADPEPDRPGGEE